MPNAPSIHGLGNVQPQTKAAAEEIATRFGIYDIGGKATTGHIPDSDHYTGLAIDVMTGSNQSAGKGEMIAQWTLTNAQRLRVKYIIWNHRYNGLDGKGWVPYTGTNPHTNHVHISFLAQGSSSSSNVGSSSTTSSDDLSGCVGQLLSSLGINI
jgi:hypothetical protein